MSNDIDGTLRITVTKDKMAAVAVVTPPSGHGACVSMDDVMNALSRTGVKHGIAEPERIQLYLEKGWNEQVSFIVATATHSTMGSDAVVAYPWRPAPGRTHEGLYVVKKGDIIAEKTPATLGENAVNVMGDVHPGEWGFDAAMKPGANVEVSEDGLVITAALEGCPRVIDGAVSVDPVYEIKGDVDDTTGSIRFDGALNIHGSVKDGFIVECTGSVAVGGRVGRARVESGGDVLVHDSICTGSHGVVSARGSVAAGSIKDSVVDAGQDVSVQSIIMDSSVHSNGTIVCASENARISGGDVRAFQSIIAANLGKDKDTKTKLTVSGKPGVRSDENAAGGGANTNGIRAVKYMHPGCMVQIGSRIKLIRDTMNNAAFTVEKNGMVMLTYFDETAGAMRVKGISAGARPKTAIIVDDARTMRMKLKKLLENAGFTVVGEADNGRKGIEMFTFLKPDLVTMDITMPDVDGLSALKAIRQIQPKARVIMISALGQKEMILESMKAGAMDFISKPLAPDQAYEILVRAAAAKIPD